MNETVLILVGAVLIVLSVPSLLQLRGSGGPGTVTTIRVLIDTISQLQTRISELERKGQDLEFQLAGIQSQQQLRNIQILELEQQVRRLTEERNALQRLVRGEGSSIHISESDVQVTGGITGHDQTVGHDQTSTSKGEHKNNE